MIFLSILILIVAIALPSINNNISSILFLRISSIIFIYAGALTLNALYIQSIGSGIGIYSGLFHVTLLSQYLDLFISIIASIILISWPTINLNKKNINLDKKFKKINYTTEYPSMVLLSTLGSPLLVSSYRVPGYNCCGLGRGSLIRKFHSNPLLLEQIKGEEGKGLVDNVSGNKGTVGKGVESVNNNLLDSLQTQASTQTPTPTPTDINLSLVKNTSDFGFVRRFKLLVCNCSLFLQNNIYNVISIFVLCIIFVIFCFNISFSDLSILKSLFYVCVVIISFTFSLVISKIYNWSDNYFIRTVQKTIFYTILFFVGKFLLIYFGLDIYSLFS